MDLGYREKEKAKKENHTGIPDNMKKRFESFSGFSFDDVRVHYNSDKPHRLNALAYTQGNRVYIAPGQEKHLGHELGHVVQRKQGKIISGDNVNGVRVNTDKYLEKEADAISNQVVCMRSIEKLEENLMGSQMCEVIQKCGDDKTEMKYEEFIEQLITIINKHINNARKNNNEISDDFWNNVREKFAAYENKNMIIRKILSSNTTGVNDAQMPSSVENNYTNYLEKNDRTAIRTGVITAFTSLKKPIEETLNDTCFWVLRYGGTSIESIKLTDSDMHNRGVGVCIVEYKAEGDNHKLVIKPEDKSFEKIVYGNGANSLANRFNQYLNNGVLGNKYKKSKIGTLNIETMDNYGSAIEFFEHKRFDSLSEKDKKNCKKSVQSTVAFASLLGLADLHVENAVYSKENNSAMQLIDAEIGMKYCLNEDNPLMTAAYKGEMTQNGVESVNFEMIKENIKYNKKYMKDFLEEVFIALKTLKTRIVLIETPELFKYRSWYLGGVIEEGDWNEYYERLKNCADIYFDNNIIKAVGIDKNKDAIINAAKKDFSIGRIPFFEITLSSGKVVQKTSDGDVEIVTFEGKSNKDFLKTMIDNRISVIAASNLTIEKSKISSVALGIGVGVGLGIGLAAYYYLNK